MVPRRPRLPRLDYKAYDRVIYAGVSFRRFAKIWQPERHHFFKPEFQRRVQVLLLSSLRARRTGAALGRLPAECMHM